MRKPPIGVKSLWLTNTTEGFPHTWYAARLNLKVNKDIALLWLLSPGTGSAVFEPCSFYEFAMSVLSTILHCSPHKYSDVVRWCPWASCQQENRTGTFSAYFLDVNTLTPWDVQECVKCVRPWVTKNTFDGLYLQNYRFTYLPLKKLYFTHSGKHTTGDIWPLGCRSIFNAFIKLVTYKRAVLT